MPTLKLPHARRHARAVRVARAACSGRRRRRARAGTASRSPPRTSSPIRRAAIDPWLDAALDWDATLAYRRHLWSLGFGVAEAMDTAQRGMGLDWPTSLELIRRTRRRSARRHPGRGRRSRRGHRPPRAGSGDVRIERRDRRLRGAMRARSKRLGGRIILMASRALAACARSPDDYARVYDRVLSQVQRAGDPALARRDVRSGARRLLGRRGATIPIMRARWTSALDVIAAQRGEGRRHQGLAARRGARRSRCARVCRRRAHVHRRRLQLRRADRRRRAGSLRRAARHLRRDRAGRLGGARPRSRAATARASTRSSRRPCRCRATSSRADALLQDRRRVHGVAQRPPGALHDGRRAAERAQPRASRRAVPARRRGRAARAIRSSRRARMRALLAMHGVA